jgi:hypothetical protein
MARGWRKLQNEELCNVQLHQSGYYWGCPVEEDCTDRTCSTHWTRDKRIQNEFGIGRKVECKKRRFGRHGRVWDDDIKIDVKIVSVMYLARFRQDPMADFCEHGSEHPAPRSYRLHSLVAADWCREVYKLWTTSLCNFLHRLLGQNIQFSILRSETPCVCSIVGGDRPNLTRVSNRNGCCISVIVL